LKQIDRVLHQNAPKLVVSLFEFQSWSLMPLVPWNVGSQRQRELKDPQIWRTAVTVWGVLHQRNPNKSLFRWQCARIGLVMEVANQEVQWVSNGQ
jgi:hypothetical protein